MAPEIKEIDIVELTEPVGHWPAGAQGTVVGEIGDLRQIEMDGVRDDPLALPVVPSSKLKLVEKFSRSSAPRSLARGRAPFWPARPV